MEALSNFFAETNWFLVFFFAILCYSVTLIRVVNERERGIIIFLGKIIKKVESGPCIVPPLGRLTKVTKNAIKVDFGTLNPEDIEKINRADPSISWYIMEESVRINWGDLESTNLSEKEKGIYLNDPFSKRLTTDPHLYFIFKVHDLQKLVEVAGGMDEAIERIKDTCISALQDMAGKTFVAKAIKEIDSISDKIKKEVEWLVGDPNAEPKPGKKDNDSWGVDVKEVRIKDLGTSHAVNIAISERSSEIAKADGRKKAKILDTDGEVYHTRGNASADRFRDEQLSIGQAALIKKRAKAASEKNGELIVKTDALVEAVKNGNVTILPLDNSLLTSAFALKDIFSGKDKIGRKIK